MGPSIASGIVAVMGWFSELPLMWGVVAVVVMVNQTMGVIEKMDTPTGMKKQKIDAIYKLAENSCRISSETRKENICVLPFTESLKQA
ncbi:MAG: hypothetical protein OXC57_13055 [Rhodobacteraceae bacterium]|nr:hypothetical protein [Paracoccaceae bacterium]